MEALETGAACVEGGRDMTYDELIESILTAQEQMLQHSIEANSVTLNGRKYGMLIKNLPPNIKPTIFGMAVKADYALPDDYDFLVQYEPPQPKTNADRIRAMTDEELAEFFAQQEYRKPVFDGWLPLCNHVMGPRTCHENGCEKCWLDWLKQVVKDGE